MQSYAVHPLLHNGNKINRENATERNKDGLQKHEHCKARRMMGVRDWQHQPSPKPIAGQGVMTAACDLAVVMTTSCDARLQLLTFLIFYLNGASGISFGGWLTYSWASLA